MKSGKRQITEGIELLNQERIKMHKAKKFQVVWNIGCRPHQISRDKKKKNNKTS